MAVTVQVNVDEMWQIQLFFDNLRIVS
jgi:hypothetical protein